MAPQRKLNKTKESNDFLRPSKPPGSDLLPLPATVSRSMKTNGASWNRYTSKMLDEANAKKILLVDEDDLRRSTRVNLLKQAGYKVQVRKDSRTSENWDHEGTFDLVIIALHRDEAEEVEVYSNLLTQTKPHLPILILSDVDAFVLPGTLSGNLMAGSAKELLYRVAGMLAGSTHVRELPPP